MSWSYGWRPYVPVAQRRANAAREAAKLSKTRGALAPVNIAGRQIAATFWGKSWCENLESYSDFSNRLPRGRTYVRNGSVVDLKVAEGKVSALVSGSSLYKIEIAIKPLAKDLWSRIQNECSGKIDSLMELLQGRVSANVMTVVTRRDGGLFPAPSEIKLECSCPDWAGMCKHVAASLYGVGARLDEKPELLFLLRGVNPAELIGQASVTEAIKQTGQAGGSGIAEADLSDVFGIELETSAVLSAPATLDGPRRAKPKVSNPAVARVKRAAQKRKRPSVKPAGKKAKRAIAPKKKIKA